jgi:hypothetical protein
LPRDIIQGEILKNKIMNGTIGQIPEFQGAGDDWNVYIERLEQYFEVNGIPEDKRNALLISVIGADSYKVLRELCHPTLPKDKLFGELCELLRKQFSPQIAIFRERTNFYIARQSSNENITTWYGRIKKLSVDCKFGDNLESILLDKFIAGMKAGTVLDRLCEENETLALTTAVDIALNKECSIQETADLNNSTNQFNFHEHKHPWMRHHHRGPLSEFNFPNHRNPFGGMPHHHRDSPGEFHAREHDHPFGSMHHHRERGPRFESFSNPHHHHGGPPGEHTFRGCHGSPPRGVGPSRGCGPPRGGNERHGCHEGRDRSPREHRNPFGGIPHHHRGSPGEFHAREHDHPFGSMHHYRGPRFESFSNPHNHHGGPPGEHTFRGCHGSPPRGENERHGCHEGRDRSPHRNENEHGCRKERSRKPNRGGSDHFFHVCRKGRGGSGDRRHCSNRGNPRPNREDAHESGNENNEQMVV